MQYVDFSTNLARQAGEIMRTNFSLGMKKEWKADNTPLTETDLAINKLVIDAVRKDYPTHGVLGEEEKYIPKGAEYIWVCDPVDGTIPFSHGIPISTFSLALTHNGEVILGVVYDPHLDRLFLAQKGKGATLNNKPIHVSDATSISQAVTSVDAIRDNLDDLPALLAAHKAKVFKLNSYVYTAVLVAAGESVGTIFGRTNPWDAAAIKVIVEEAGGKVTDLQGNEQRYDQDLNGCVASNGRVHDELLDLVKKSLIAVER